MTCHDSTPPTSRQISFPLPAQRVPTLIVTDADYVAFSTDRQIQAFTPPLATSPATLTITMPLDPTLGQEITLVAVTANILVDGNANNVLTQTSIALGRSVTYRFAGNAFKNDSSQPGNWVPEHA